MAVNGVDVQLAETAGEVALCRGLERLILEEQHVALGQGLTQALDRSLRERSREVETRYKAADGGG